MAYGFYIRAGGAPQISKRREFFIKPRFAVCILAILFTALLAGCTNNGVASQNSGVYNSPENAISTFIAAVKGGDQKKIMASFAIKDYVNGYDRKNPDAQYIPNETFSDREAEVSQAIGMFYAGLQVKSLDELDNYANNITTNGAAFTALSDPAQYQTLEVLRCDIPETDAKRHAKNIEKNIYSLHGADGWDYRLTLLSSSGTTYCCGVTFAIYGGKYEIYSLTYAWRTCLHPSPHSPARRPNILT